MWAPQTNGWSSGVVTCISDGRTRDPKGTRGIVTKGYVSCCTATTEEIVLTRVLLSKSSDLFSQVGDCAIRRCVFDSPLHVDVVFAPTHMSTAFRQLSTNTFTSWTQHIMCRIGGRGSRPGRTTTFKSKLQKKRRWRSRVSLSNLKWSSRKGRSGRREGQLGAKNADPFWHNP